MNNMKAFRTADNENFMLEVIWIAAEIHDDSFSRRMEEFFNGIEQDDTEPGHDHELIKQLGAQDAGYIWDDVDAIRDVLTYNRKLGFLCKVTTPVPPTAYESGHSCSWGHIQSFNFYAETLEEAMDMAAQKTKEYRERKLNELRCKQEGKELS